MSGSVQYDSVTLALTDRLTTRMLYLLRFAQHPVERGDDVRIVPLPFASRTFSEMSSRRAPCRPSVRLSRRRSRDDPRDMRAVPIVVIGQACGR